MDEFFTLTADEAQLATEALFVASGSPLAEAELMGQRLVQANLTGHDSHGLIRAPQYMEFLREGRVYAGRHAKVVQDNGAAARMSGEWGYGQPAATAAMAQAIARAERFQMAAVSVSELFHIGRLADYALMAAEAGMIGMVFTSAGGFSPLVAPFGGNQRRMSTNPMACAFPGHEPYPVVFDFATSALAEGKFKVMREGGLQAPAGVIQDKEGNPSTTPQALYDGGSILPLGGGQGYKGYLLNFLMEVLGGLLSGGGFMGKQGEAPFNNCTLMLALNVSAFRALPDFRQELGELIAYLKATRSAPGEEVLAPGEKEARTEKARREGGLPLAKTTLERLQAELERYQVGQNLLADAKPLAAE